MLKNKRVFKGKLISVSIKRQRLPNGYMARLEVVDHIGAALIVPVISQDKILLLRQFRPVINGYLYELPAGTLNKKESVIACARREIVEETGYSAEKFSLLGEIYPVPGYSTEKIAIFKAERLFKKEVAAEKDEVIQVKVFNRSQIKKLFKKKKLKDAKTICALAMAGWL
ncbi:MAG: NUDIX hydrolase [Candidatus Omnitrophica bacterium]|nr:NUDIX hydrolase [Candidatus Omnitrophota bacterium]